MTFACSVILVCILGVTSIGISFGRSSYPTDVIEDSDLDTYQLIQKYNYPVETHFVTTEDNYILRLHRISNPGGKPILLQHGLLDSSAGFILMGPTQSLGYYLFDKGYDVWLGNSRGNRYSRNHTTLNPNYDDSFWDFSWHEIAVFDIPATIDYILKATSAEKLFYAGHSQGTTVLFVMLSMRPEYNDKIILAHALAPVAFMKHIRAPMLPYAESARKIFSKNMELLPHSVSNISKNICFSGKQAEDMCIKTMFLCVGKNYEQFNKTAFRMILGHIPAGVASKQVEHYLQLVKSDQFCQYDHGQDNLKVYNQSMPPSYDLKKVTAPIALWYSSNDFLAQPIDVLRLAELLPNKVEAWKMELPQWNHIDFLYAIDSRNMLYKHIEELNKRFS